MVDKVVKPVFWFFRKIDRNNALKLSKLIGYILYISNYRKSVVEKNLQIAFPEKDSDWRNYIRKKCMENIGRVLVEFPNQQDYVQKGKIKDMVLFERGLEDILKEERGAIITTAHISNWEIAGAGLSAYVDGIVDLAYRQRNERINKLLTDIRTSSGIEIVFHDQPLKKMVELLNKGKLLTFFVDQNTLKHRGVFVEFFGLKASTVSFPAKLALRYRKPIYFAYSYFKEEDKRYYLRMEKLSYREGKTEEETLLNIVQAYTEAVERAVREFPEQYLWVHKRWKTRENEELERIYS